MTASTSTGVWDNTWDAAVLTGTLRELDAVFDPESNLICGHVGSEYSYQSSLRNQVVHPTRTSMEYALYLLESGEKSRINRAAQILDRLDRLQEKNQWSTWYGLWSWYAEEPLDRMPSADFNWADFNGALLLCMIFRHRSQLSQQTLEKVHRMLEGCCTSIRKRNVFMGYTNIACMGTFVTLVGSEVLQDADLHRYASKRLIRFASFIDQTGSFEEYNSPTYNKVVVQNLSLMLAFAKDPQALQLTQKIHERIWLHIAEHWHLPTRQIAAPMSRCYSNDLGPQIWIQKALNNALTFASKDDLRLGPPKENNDVALVDYRCPDEFRHYFTKAGQTRSHREVFILGSQSSDTVGHASADVVGSTFLTPDFCIGSANRSDFWIQRRPLMAYWGDAEHPVRCLQIRLLKDGYDFSSGLFYSVQSKGAVLGQARFRSDGGDRHVSLDPIQDHRFEASEITLRVSFDVWDDAWKLFVESTQVTARLADLPFDSALFVDTGTIQIGLRFLSPAFGDYQPQLRFLRSGQAAAIEMVLMSSAKPVSVIWEDLNSAGCGMALLVKERTSSSLFSSRELDLSRFAISESNDLITSSWQTTQSTLKLTTAGSVGTGSFMDGQFRSAIDGNPVPAERLSEILLVGRPHEAT